MQSKKMKIFKLIVLIVVIAMMVALTIRLLPIFEGISTEQGRIDFKKEIESLGVEGIFIIIGLMVAQIFLPILPRRTSGDTCWYVIWTNWRSCYSPNWSVY